MAPPTPQSPPAVAQPVPFRGGGHLDTLLRSPTRPILLRNPAESDAAAVAAILSDPRNMLYEPGGAETGMTAEAAAAVVSRMRQSAAQPTVLGADGRPTAGPGRVNLVIVHVSEEVGPDGDVSGEEEIGGERGTVIGLSGYGNIDTLVEDDDDDDDKTPPTTTGTNGAGTAKRITRAGDVGAMVNHEFRGRGYAAEAIRLSVEWGFAPLSAKGLQLDRVTAGTDAENEGMIGLLRNKFAWEGERREKKDQTGKFFFSYEITPEQWAAKVGAVS